MPDIHQPAPRKPTHMAAKHSIILRQHLQPNEQKHSEKATWKCDQQKAFPGATAVDMYRHYMIPTLENNTPDNAIIHCGINDLLSMEDQLTDETAANVAERIIRCGLVCKEYGVSQIAISSVLHKSGTHLQAITNQINNKLHTWCREHSFNFINNINIPFTNPYDYTPFSIMMVCI